VVQCSKGIDVTSLHKIELASGFEIDVMQDDGDKHTVIVVSSEKMENAMLTAITLSQSEAIDLGQALVDVSNGDKKGVPIL